MEEKNLINFDVGKFVWVSIVHMDKFVRVDEHFERICYILLVLVLLKSSNILKITFST